MKKIYLIWMTIALCGCNEWLDVNDSPNRPTDVSADLILPSAENFIATRLGGTIFNYCGFFAQYWDQGPVANQYNTEAEYRFGISFFDNDYNSLYAGALQDLESVRSKALETDDAGNYFAATVLRAYTFQIIVDMLDYAPYSEALKGSEIPMPKWDSGESIYAGILAEIEEAQAKLTSTSTIPSDLLLNGNLSQWIGFANALKLKLYMRASYAQDNSSKIMALINANNFFQGDIAFNAYADESGKRNPWYETNTIGLGTVNNIAAYPIITYLVSTNDPRLPKLFNQATASKEYEGAIPGNKTAIATAQKKNEDYSWPVIFVKNATNAVRPVYFYSQSELQFFIAEAKLRFANDDTGARVAYENAIDASFSMYGLTDGSVLYGSGKSCEWVTSQSLEEKLEKIMMQKWVALCMVNHYESWTEIRRTGYPKLSRETGSAILNNPSVYMPKGQLISPVINELGFGNLVQRLPYPQAASNYNDNTPSQDPIEIKKTSVWWDKRSN
ncbi:MAG: SusD/RagB family nutrient-binding outer membrane lipoprotein [Tannerella sp.]|jgi:hypothetical protein|nr:SusD/RagB family nutrient-binding outer membrane lipoprotein [Tannerella sp.]